MPVSPPEKMPFVFTETRHAKNPLVGHFWSPSQQRLVSVHDMISDLPLGGWLLLGELHDHPDHQNFEAAMLLVLAKSGKLGRVAMEQLRESQQELISPWYGKGNEVSGEDIDWNPQGWDWMTYREPLAQALNHADKVLAVDPSKERAGKAYRGELDLLPASESLQRLMTELIDAGHCGKLPEKYTQPMTRVQFAKDQFMADTLIDNALPGKIGVLIAGMQHSRRDYGVPYWLETKSITANSDGKKPLPYLSVLMIPAGEITDPNHYLSSRFQERLPADYIFFTPAMPEKDYCAGIKSPHKK